MIVCTESIATALSVLPLPAALDAALILQHISLHDQLACQSIDDLSPSLISQPTSLNPGVPQQQPLQASPLQQQHSFPGNNSQQHHQRRLSGSSAGRPQQHQQQQQRFSGGGLPPKAPAMLPQQQFQPQQQAFPYQGAQSLFCYAAVFAVLPLFLCNSCTSGGRRKCGQTKCGWSLQSVGSKAVLPFLF